MQNFNTNQTRFFYVAGAVDDALDTNLDIVLGQAVTGEFYFKYKNNDGLITRSDTIDPKKVVCFSKTAASALATPLMAHTITVDTDHYANVAALAGKTVKMTVTLHQVFDYDDSNSISFTVEHTVANSETAANFYLALKTAVEKALPKNYPAFTAASSGDGLVLTEAAQKYVRGKLEGGVIPFSVSFNVSGDNDPQWGKDAVAASGSTISGTYKLADLEYFAAGEKGDIYRGSVWPNDYPFNPAINLASSYDVLNIEYYWAGEAENVQKSPRLIQVAGSTAVINSLYSSVAAAINGGGSGSGSGTGA